VGRVDGVRAAAAIAAKAGQRYAGGLYDPASTIGGHCRWRHHRSYQHAREIFASTMAGKVGVGLGAAAVPLALLRSLR